MHTCGLSTNISFCRKQKRKSRNQLVRSNVTMKLHLQTHSFSLSRFRHQITLYEVTSQYSTIIHSSFKFWLDWRLGIWTNKMKEIPVQKRRGGQEMRRMAEKSVKLRRQQGTKLQTACDWNEEQKYPRGGIRGRSTTQLVYLIVEKASRPKKMVCNKL